MLQAGQTDGEVFEVLEGEINAFSVSTVCDKRELFWRRHAINFKWWSILRMVLVYWWDWVRGAA
jgi:hypothetical protein